MKWSSISFRRVSLIMGRFRRLYAPPSEYSWRSTLPWWINSTMSSIVVNWLSRSYGTTFNPPLRCWMRYTSWCRRLKLSRVGPYSAKSMISSIRTQIGRWYPCTRSSLRKHSNPTSFWCTGGSTLVKLMTLLGSSWCTKRKPSRRLKSLRSTGITIGRRGSHWGRVRCLSSWSDTKRSSSERESIWMCHVNPWNTNSNQLNKNYLTIESSWSTRRTSPTSSWRLSISPTNRSSSCSSGRRICWGGYAPSNVSSWWRVGTSLYISWRWLRRNSLSLPNRSHRRSWRAYLICPWGVSRVVMCTRRTSLGTWIRIPSWSRFMLSRTSRVRIWWTWRREVYIVVALVWKA